MGDKSYKYEIHADEPSNHPIMDRFRPLIRTSANLLKLELHWPLARLYAVITCSNSAWLECVTVMALSRTYRSTPLSSAMMELLARPKSMITTVRSSSSLTRMLLVVRSPWIKPPSCILATAFPT